MKKLTARLTLLALFITLFTSLSCTKEEVRPTSAKQERTSAMPVYSHIFIIWMENKAYSNIVGSSSAPYMNSLISQGTLFTNFNALQNPSQPNYIGAFAGTRCGVGNDNQVTPKSLTQKNLYTQLASVGKSFETYAEGLPSTGSTIWSSGRYRGRHDPARNFANVNQNCRKPFTAIPANLNSCGTIVYLVPNLDHDMHDQSMAYGDNWLHTDPQMQSIINYCKNPANNSLFVLYFDEGYSGNNKIAVTFIGNRVKQNFRVTTSYNHYNLTHTILSMYGAAQVNTAATYQDLAGWYN